jgi:hypothetical protein
MLTIKERIKNLAWLSVTIFVLSIIAGTTIHIFAAFTEPLTAPSASDQDFPENILGANNADNDYDSTSVTGNQDGSMVERLEYMDDVFFGYSKQQYQVYDDYNCANNNDETTDSACAAGDPEYTGEEGVWASTTDTNLNGSLVASGLVKKDVRTGLYWADCYDSTSGQGSCDSIDNDFDIWDDGGCSGDGSGTDCSDADIVNGDCESVDYDCYDNDGDGSALDYCLDLSLDADGDGTDETDWRLPTQKELLLAYINGAANNVHNPAYYYWSSTEGYNGASLAWLVNLRYGITTNRNKTFNYYARCVHR